MSFIYHHRRLTSDNPIVNIPGKSISASNLSLSSVCVRIQMPLLIRTSRQLQCHRYTCSNAHEYRSFPFVLPLPCRSVTAIVHFDTQIVCLLIEEYITQLYIHVLEIILSHKYI